MWKRFRLLPRKTLNLPSRAQSPIPKRKLRFSSSCDGERILIVQYAVLSTPKNNSGRDVMIDAPAPIDEKQLEELSLKLNLKS
jgi:hypothetical protein